MIARYHRHRIASAIYEVTLSAQVTITHQRNPFFVPTITAPNAGGPKFRGGSAIRSVLQLVGSLVILYVPYYLLTLWSATSNSLEDPPKINQHLFTTASILLACSPPINGFLYGIKSKPLRTTFKNYWRIKQTKSELNQEIQARTPSTCGSRRPSLTPLGFLTKPTIQRRLSEALLDVHKVVNSPQRHKIKRITTELSWRPTSANCLNFLPDGSPRVKHTASCNTLRVPGDQDISTIAEDKDSKQSVPNNRLFSPASLIYQKFFSDKTDKKTSAVQNVLDGTPTKRSPRITITRTLSEESREPSARKWLLSKETDVHEGHKSDGSSDSSETSEETSSGKIYLSLDERRGKDKEVELLLTWPTDSCNVTKPVLIRQKSLIHHDVVLH